MATGDRKDPLMAYNFTLEISGKRAGFRECSGLDSSQDPTEYREGNEKVLTVRKLPGLVKYSNISLKYGVTDDTSLWQWLTKAVTGDIERVDGTISLLDDKGAEKLKWKFKAGWPTKWTGATFNATSNEVAIETLEIAHEGIEKG
ncbi:phage tail protein [Calothrix sp. NIES-2098]|uniref:phage tail protein n=1 Tax=Calothrix sp. NIES-2098 TaxID=1954171 RepID=UPI000B5F5C16|nr:phage tail protein [Calothrix sp. NIES-2098]